MKSFEVHGTFKMGDKIQNFTKVFNGMNEKNVIEKVYCDIGS
ncbi:MAG: 50S ribosomal protein L18a, partial [Methanomicrobia archaeon]|nr:50S ribosomal protein L18a [Methanomicrobia archaeon]